MFTGLLQDVIKGVYECPGEELSQGKGPALSHELVPPTRPSMDVSTARKLSHRPAVGTVEASSRGRDIPHNLQPLPLPGGGGGAENPKLLILEFWELSEWAALTLEHPGAYPESSH